MSRPSPKDTSFWTLAIANWPDVIAGWDLWLSLILATALTGLVPLESAAARLQSVAATEVSLASALIGLVLAALAILTVFLDKGYLAILTEAAGGLEADLFQFSFLAALLVAAISASVVAIVTSPTNPLFAFPLLWTCLVFLFWSVFAAMSLVGFIGSHTTNRAKYLLNQKDDEAHH